MIYFLSLRLETLRCCIFLKPSKAGLKLYLNIVFFTSKWRVQCVVGWFLNWQSQWPLLTGHHAWETWHNGCTVSSTHVNDSVNCQQVPAMWRQNLSPLRGVVCRGRCDKLLVGLRSERTDWSRYISERQWCARHHARLLLFSSHTNTNTHNTHTHIFSHWNTSPSFFVLSLLHTRYSYIAIEKLSRTHLHKNVWADTNIRVCNIKATHMPKTVTNIIIWSRHYKEQKRVQEFNSSTLPASNLHSRHKHS